MAKAKVPGGVTPDHFITIRRHLRNVLRKAGAELAIMRLNETGKTSPAPVFIGWVEAQELMKERVKSNHPDPGLYRFGDTASSVIYETCVAAGGTIKWRNWNLDTHFKEKRPAEKSQASKAGVNYQRFIGIMVNGDPGKMSRCVGTLVVGFSKKPTARALNAADRVLRHSAQDPRSPLVRFLRSHLELGGPTFKK